MAFSYRKTSQTLMPAVKPEAEQGKYNIYPAFNISGEKINRGIDSLVEKISGEKIIILDGFSGVLFDLLRNQINLLLNDTYNIVGQWINVHDFLKTDDEITEMVLPFLGGNDPLFGTRTTLSLIDFFSIEKLQKIHLSDYSKPVIIYGIGAGLLTNEGFLVYFDLPKNELQYRSRAGGVTNLGSVFPDDPGIMYKRFYFIDWVVISRYKQTILDRIDILADGQRADDITWMNGDDFRESLHDLGLNSFRTRPWFEPGAWGGSWISENIPGINRDVHNYSWSFELITPENGLVFESSGLMLEFSFDFLMFQEAKAILGDAYKRFRTDFPIRFDLLDTFDGGNLSIQCHPRPDYMKENFGENFTQEETYYILDTKDNAEVYLGFTEDIVKKEFYETLKESFRLKKSATIEKFVQKHPSHKHDLFLIPYGTIHGSGKNNLVLEISSTPYIFTFKLYDWLRPDLEGKMRPLNIERGMDNLYFERKGNKILREFISRPMLLEEGTDWQLFHLPTHSSQLYDVVRYHFKSSIEVTTNNKCHVLSLVEGKNIFVVPGENTGRRFSYAETFVIPAAVSNYKVYNESEKQAILILAFVK
jgi:mannose-6-phosphate isomerase class I